jgi:hypothetical protein
MYNAYWTLPLTWELYPSGLLASSGNFLLTVHDNLSVPPSRILQDGTDKLSQTVGKDLEDGTDRFSETSVRNYHCLQHNNLEERSSQLKPEITHWLFNFFKNGRKWSLARILTLSLFFILSVFQMQFRLKFCTQYFDE